MDFKFAKRPMGTLYDLYFPVVVQDSIFFVVDEI